MMGVWITNIYIYLHAYKPACLNYSLGNIILQHHIRTGRILWESFNANVDQSYLKASFRWYISSTSYFYWIIYSIIKILLQAAICERLENVVLKYQLRLNKMQSIIYLRNIKDYATYFPDKSYRNKNTTA